jgi:hypothetical protein
MWLLGIELRTSRRADSALNQWATSPAQAPRILCLKLSGACPWAFLTYSYRMKPSFSCSHSLAKASSRNSPEKLPLLKSTNWSFGPTRHNDKSPAWACCHLESKRNHAYGNGSWRANQVKDRCCSRSHLWTGLHSVRMITTQKILQSQGWDNGQPGQTLTRATLSRTPLAPWNNSLFNLKTELWSQDPFIWASVWPSIITSLFSLCWVRGQSQAFCPKTLFKFLFKKKKSFFF